MKRQNVVSVVLALVVVAAVIWALRWQKPVVAVKAMPQPSQTTTPSPTQGSTAAFSLASPSAFVQQPGGPYEPRDPRWQWWNENIRRDPTFQWKMPIDFYGKVVD